MNTSQLSSSRSVRLTCYRYFICFIKKLQVLHLFNWKRTFTFSPFSTNWYSCWGRRFCFINCNGIYFSIQEQIAYFLTQEAVYLLVHFNFSECIFILRHQRGRKDNKDLNGFYSMWLNRGIFFNPCMMAFLYLPAHHQLIKQFVTTAFSHFYIRGWDIPFSFPWCSLLMYQKDVSSSLIRPAQKGQNFLFCT